MDSTLTAVVTGVLTLIGMLISNFRSRAVIEVKLDVLSERVRQRNEV